MVKDLDFSDIYRNVCPFWAENTANIWNKLIILILMAQYHNAPSDLGNLASGEIGIGYQNT